MGAARLQAETKARSSDSLSDAIVNQWVDARTKRRAADEWRQNWLGLAENLRLEGAAPHEIEEMRAKAQEPPSAAFMAEMRAAVHRSRAVGHPSSLGVGDLDPVRQ